MRKLLITGGTGFIGHNIAAVLQQDPCFDVQIAGRSGQVDFLHSDLSLDGEARSLIERSLPDAIIHCVGARNGSVEQLRAANISAQRELLRAAALLSVPPQIILMGSAAEYGPQPGFDRIPETAICRPVSQYGRTKLLATRLALCYRRRTNSRITVVRPFNVVGRGMHGIIGRCLRARGSTDGFAGLERELSNNPLTRDFVSVNDITEVCRRLLCLEAPPPLVNVCTGMGRTFPEVLALVKNHFGEATSVKGQTGGGGSIIGDPTFCEAAVGVRPSEDISEALREAASIIKPLGGFHLLDG